MKNQIELSVCDCVECKDSESPCHFDCESDKLCEGCREAYEDYHEMLFESNVACGRC